MASLKTLYTGIVEPHFPYCCSFMASAGATDISHLQKLQIRASTVKSLQIAALIPQADCLFRSWAGQPLKNSSGMNLDNGLQVYRCSMICLHNTCVTSSPDCQDAPPATSGTLRKSQQMGKNAFLSEELNYGIAVLLNVRKASSLNCFKKSIKG